MSGCAVSVLDDEGVPLPYGRSRNVNLQRKPAQPSAGKRGPHRFQYPGDITSVWNGPNHRHCCNDFRCLFCTALWWVRLPHCKCRLSPVSLDLPLDACIR
ncbi:hypothetical protein M758_UG217100 [Ceratodon purpureus]|nr:hypothetical protein M758_UG217100 [Ceratodon purpureus]KAG0596020.1 hypothetical protein M758_UG217100 [Ceratodon purpureus]